MLSRRIACSLLMVFSVALVATRAEAQLGCLVNVGGEFFCEPAQEPCTTSDDCDSGDSCDVSTLLCRTTLRTPCALCVRGPDCPAIDGATTLPRTLTELCPYLFPCGARFEIRDTGVVRSPSLCFLDPDRLTPVLWPDGDCDGDGERNGDEVSSSTQVCASVVTSHGPTLERSHLVLVDTAGTGAPGLDVGDDATPTPFVGIGCNENQDCPDARSGAEGRCVYITADDGVCLYSGLDPTLEQLPDEDGTCSSMDLPASASNRQELQDRDLDRDGIPNADDPQVCASLQVVEFSSSVNALRSAPGQIPMSCGSAGAAERVVLPGDRCATSTLLNAFAVACTTRHDCPLVGSPSALVDARCVQFPGSGVCVYGGGVMDDLSCRVATELGTCGFGMDYGAFADGNCDGADALNRVDPEMCAAAVVGPDTGMRADVGPSADASEPFTDAAASIRPPPPTGVTFGGGGGCVCGVGGRKPGPGSALLALGLLGAVWARRRRS